MSLIDNPDRPMFLEYETTKGRKPRYCCYKDKPCATHATVLNNLLRMFTGEIEADPKNLEAGIANDKTQPHANAVTDISFSSADSNTDVTN